MYVYTYIRFGRSIYVLHTYMGSEYQSVFSVSNHFTAQKIWNQKHYASFPFFSDFRCKFLYFIKIYIKEGNNYSYLFQEKVSPCTPPLRVSNLVKDVLNFCNPPIADITSFNIYIYEENTEEGENGVNFFLVSYCLRCKVIEIKNGVLITTHVHAHELPCADRYGTLNPKP